MISEITNYTNKQLTNLANDKLINIDGYSILPTYLQLTTQSLTKYRVFHYLHDNVITNLFLVQISMDENTFISIYHLTDDKNKNEVQLYDFIRFCFQELNTHKLSVELYDEKNSFLNSYLKMGFEIEGIFKKHILINSSKKDVYRLALSKNNFKKYIENYIPKILNGQKFNLNIGDNFTEKRIITQKDIELFAQVSNDYNPIHLDEKSAQDKGFNTTIAHGILSASFISKIIGMDFPGNGSIYLSQNLNFIRPIYPNIDVLIKVKILSIVGKKITLLSQVMQNNQIAIQGIATVLSNQQQTK